MLGRFYGHDKGGLYHFFPKFALFFFTCHNFSPLSSVQIIITPACCLLCGGGTTPFFPKLAFFLYLS